MVGVSVRVLGKVCLLRLGTYLGITCCTFSLSLSLSLFPLHKCAATTTQHSILLNASHDFNIRGLAILDALIMLTYLLLTLPHSHESNAKCLPRILLYRSFLHSTKS